MGPQVSLVRPPRSARQLCQTQSRVVNSHRAEKPNTAATESGHTRSTFARLSRQANVERHQTVPNPESVRISLPAPAPVETKPVPTPQGKGSPGTKKRRPHRQRLHVLRYIPIDRECDTSALPVLKDDRKDSPQRRTFDCLPVMASQKVSRVPSSRDLDHYPSQIPVPKSKTKPQTQTESPATKSPTTTTALKPPDVGFQSPSRKWSKGYGQLASRVECKQVFSAATMLPLARSEHLERSAGPDPSDEKEKDANKEKEHLSPRTRNRTSTNHLPTVGTENGIIGKSAQNRPRRESAIFSSTLCFGIDKGFTYAANQVMSGAGGAFDSPSVKAKAVPKLERSASHMNMNLMFGQGAKQNPPSQSPVRQAAVTAKLERNMSSRNLMSMVNIGPSKHKEEAPASPRKSASTKDSAATQHHGGRSGSNSPVRSPRASSKEPKLAKSESVTAALQEKLAFEAVIGTKKGGKGQRSPEAVSLAERRHVWKGINGVFKKKLLVDWYKHMKTMDKK